MIRNFLFSILLMLTCFRGFAQVYTKEPAWYKLYDVKFYALNLEVNDTSTYIKGNTLIKLLIKEESDTLVFDFNPSLTIDSIYIGSKKIMRFSFQKDLLIIKPGSRLPASSVEDVTIYYKGKVLTNSFFSSLSNETEVYWKIPVTWTLSESFGAKNWFPCKQQLSDKADSCWVFLTIPKGCKAGSNGVLTDTVEVNSKQVQYRWKSHYPVAYYLISFTVANYQDYSFYVKIPGRSDSLLVQNYLYNRPGYLENNKNNIDQTAEFIKLYSKLFGLYPFYDEKYGHCVAPISGGMEHQTMTTLVNFGYGMVSHELGHQWFGDNTTCATWQDIWINEGFASYCEYLALENLESKASADSWLNDSQRSAMRDTAGSVFVPAASAQDEIRIFSTNLSYKKGAVIIHMLRNVIHNDTVFFNAIKSYLSEYRYASATGEDFRKVMEKETGLDLKPFFDQWYYGKGYPQFDISWKSTGDSLWLNVSQIPSSRSIAFFNTPFDIKIKGTDKDSVLRFIQNRNPQVFKIKYSGTINSIEFDPEGWLLKKILTITQLSEIPSDDDYFQVSPNPFNDNLYLTFKEISAKDEKITIITMNGAVVNETYARKKKEATIGTSSLRPGIYLLVVSHGKSRYIRKVLKTNDY
jgi:aminopeptidase N